MNVKEIFEMKSLPVKRDHLNPDSSEIRILAQVKSGGLRHCTLPPGKVTLPIRHKTVNEIWYCLSGDGEIWQGKNGDIQVESFSVGDSFTVPVGNGFQFRNAGESDLCVLIASIPKWSADEAENARGYW